MEFQFVSIDLAPEVCPKTYHPAVGGGTEDVFKIHAPRVTGGFHTVAAYRNIACRAPDLFSKLTL